MTAVTYTIFGAGIIQQWIAAGAALSYLIGQSQFSRLRISVWVATTGLLCLLVASILRFALWSAVPGFWMLLTMMTVATAPIVASRTRAAAKGPPGSDSSSSSGVGGSGSSSGSCGPLCIWV